MIYQSSPAVIDIPQQSWPAWFLAAIETHGDKIALIEGETGRQLTFTELGSRIHALACALQSRGIKPGDVVAIFASNSPEYVIAFQASILAGAVVTTANPQYTAAELAHQLTHAGAVCLFTDEDLIEKSTEAVNTAGINSLIFTQPDPSAAPASWPSGSESIGALIAEYQGQRCALLDIDPTTTPAVMPYSSGTTGLPKGVMLSHTNILINCLQLNLQQNTTGPALGDRVMGVLPLFHIFGMTVNMNTGLGNGATLVTLRRFEPQLFLSLIEKYKINLTYVVPPIVLFLGTDSRVADFDISSLNYMMSGAAPLAKDQVISISEKIDCAIHQGYGLTEASPVTHREPDQVHTHRYGTVGVLVPGTEAMIVDVDTGQPVSAGDTGELLVRGPQVMMGYFNDAEASRNTVDSEGWLHTGDISYADDDGYFYVVDRLKELIKYKGYQVAPAELEGLLLTHPLVKDVAVVPAQDPQAGEVPKAFIVLKAPSSDTTEQAVQRDADDIMAWVESRVAPFKKIRKVEFTDEIPKSPSGKILRRLLRDVT